MFGQKMNLISNNERQLVHPRSSVAKKGVGFFISRDYDIVSSQPRVRTIIVSRRHSNAQVLAAWLLDGGVSLKLLVLLASKRAQRSKIDRFSISLKDMLENTDLCDKRLSARRGTSENQVLSVQDAGLYRVFLWRIELVETLAL